MPTKAQLQAENDQLREQLDEANRTIATAAREAVAISQAVQILSESQAQLKVKTADCVDAIDLAANPELDRRFPF
jgi:regulator of replication initiation timing